MFEKRKGSGVLYKINFHEGPREFVENEFGELVVKGDVVEIEINDNYWRNFYTVQRISGRLGDKNREELALKYYVSRSLHDLVLKLCGLLDVDSYHAKNLMVPLSDLFFSVTGSNELYLEGLDKEASKLEELILRIREPGKEPNNRKKGVHKRDYLPTISRILIDTGSVERTSKRSMKRVLATDSEYSFRHDTILRIFQFILSDAFIGAKGDHILELLSKRSESYRLVKHIKQVYDYIVEFNLFRKGHLASRPDSIHNDACKKTGFLVETVVSHYKWEYCESRNWVEKAVDNLKIKEDLIADLEQGVTQDLAKKYYHILKSS